MPKVFKKLSKGANKVFNKVGHDTQRFFTKTVPDSAKKVGGAFEDFGNKTLDGMKQAGNFLEKNAGLIGDGLGAVAMASGIGAPIGAALIAGGNANQQIGSNMKTLQSQIRRDVNTMADQAKQQGLSLQNHGKQAIQQNLQALNSNVGFAKQQAQQAIKNAVDSSKAQANLALSNASNALTSGSNALTSAKFV